MRSIHGQTRHLICPSCKHHARMRPKTTKVRPCTDCGVGICHHLGHIGGAGWFEPGCEHLCRRCIKAREKEWLRKFSERVEGGAA